MTIEDTLAKIAGDLGRMSQALARIEAQAGVIEKAVADPAPLYEMISTAIKRRKRSRETFVGAMKDGRVRFRTHPGRGGPNYEMLIEDLDKHFPRKE